MTRCPFPVEHDATYERVQECGIEVESCPEELCVHHCREVGHNHLNLTVAELAVLRAEERLGIEYEGAVGRVS